jgi:hypothetical protein
LSSASISRFQRNRMEVIMKQATHCPSLIKLS